MYLICHVTSHDPLIERSCEFMDRSFLCYVTTLTSLVAIIIVRGCSIITSRIGGGGKQVTENKRGEWYLMKSHNVTVKKIIKPFFCTIVTRSGFH